MAPGKQGTRSAKAAAKKRNHEGNLKVQSAGKGATGNETTLDNLVDPTKFDNAAGVEDTPGMEPPKEASKTVVSLATSLVETSKKEEASVDSSELEVAESGNPTKRKLAFEDKTVTSKDKVYSKDQLDALFGPKVREAVFESNKDVAVSNGDEQLAADKPYSKDKLDALFGPKADAKVIANGTVEVVSDGDKKLAAQKTPPKLSVSSLESSGSSPKKVVFDPHSEDFDLNAALEALSDDDAKVPEAVEIASAPEEESGFAHDETRVIIYGPYCIGSLKVVNKKIDPESTKWVCVAVIAGGFELDGMPKHHFNNYMLGKQVVSNSRFLQFPEVRDLLISDMNMIHLVDETGKKLIFSNDNVERGVPRRAYVLQVPDRGADNWKRPGPEIAMAMLSRFGSLQKYMTKVGKMSEDPKQFPVDIEKPEEHLIGIEHLYYKTLYELFGLSGVCDIYNLVHGERQLCPLKYGGAKIYPVGKVLKPVSPLKRNLLLNIPETADDKRVNRLALKSIAELLKWPKKLCQEFGMYNSIFMEPSYTLELQDRKRQKQERKG